MLALVDDDADVRVLDAASNVSGTRREAFTSGAEFLRSMGHEPDCLVLDLHMPEMNGFDVQAALARAARPFQSSSLPAAIPKMHARVPAARRECHLRSRSTTKRCWLQSTWPYRDESRKRRRKRRITLPSETAHGRIDQTDSGAPRRTIDLHARRGGETGSECRPLFPGRDGFLLGAPSTAGTVAARMIGSP